MWCSDVVKIRFKITSFRMNSQTCIWCRILIKGKIMRAAPFSFLHILWLAIGPLLWWVALLTNSKILEVKERGQNIVGDHGISHWSLFADIQLLGCFTENWKLPSVQRNAESKSWTLNQIPKDFINTWQVDTLSLMLQWLLIQWSVLLFASYWWLSRRLCEIELPYILQYKASLYEHNPLSYNTFGRNLIKERSSLLCFENTSTFFMADIPFYKVAINKPIPGMETNYHKI